MSKNSLAAEFTSLGPWVYRFEINGAGYGGTISAAGDKRLRQFLDFAPRSRRILELGSLEGAHTIELAKHADEIVAIEGRTTNMRKAEFIKRTFRANNIRFVQANLEETDLASFGQFDAAFCCGLLYHLPEPWSLIEQLARVASRLFVWTHYADDLRASEIRHGCRGLIHREGGPNEPLSGMSETAFWPTLGSLIGLLTTSGYKIVHVLENDPQHQNAPAVTIAAAQRTALSE